MFLKQRFGAKPKRQHGNMIIMAVFIVVVMSLLASNLMRIKWSNQDTLTRENLGTQAWFLANSASEWALTRLYPIGGDGSLSELVTNCSSISGNTSARDDLAEGLPCSTPQVTCTAPESSLPDDLKHFRVTTVAICSSGSIFQVQREQEVWLRAVDE